MLLYQAVLRFQQLYPARYIREYGIGGGIVSIGDGVNGVSTAAVGIGAIAVIAHVILLNVSNAPGFNKAFFAIPPIALEKIILPLYLFTLC